MGSWRSSDPSKQNYIYGGIMDRNTKVDKDRFRCLLTTDNQQLLLNQRRWTKSDTATCGFLINDYQGPERLIITPRKHVPLPPTIVTSCVPFKSNLRISSCFVRAAASYVSWPTVKSLSTVAACLRRCSCCLLQLVRRFLNVACKDLSLSLYILNSGNLSKRHYSHGCLNVAPALLTAGLFCICRDRKSVV